MNPLIEISATTDQLNSHFDLLHCFLNSAWRLYADACDGLAKNRQYPIGAATNDIWYQQIIIAFYLLRHALELAVKAFIKEVKNKDVSGHNIKEIWEENIRNNFLTPEHSFSVEQAFTILAKYHILEDEQLFRYCDHKNGRRLKNLIPITHEEFEVLSKAVYVVRQAIVEGMDAKSRGLMTSKSVRGD